MAVTAWDVLAPVLVLAPPRPVVLITTATTAPDPHPTIGRIYPRG